MKKVLKEMDKYVHWWWLLPVGVVLLLWADVVELRGILGVAALLWGVWDLARWMKKKKVK